MENLESNLMSFLEDDTRPLDSLQSPELKEANTSEFFPLWKDTFSTYSKCPFLSEPDKLGQLIQQKIAKRQDRDVVYNNSCLLLPTGIKWTAFRARLPDCLYRNIGPNFITVRSLQANPEICPALDDDPRNIWAKAGQKSKCVDPNFLLKQYIKKTMGISWVKDATSQHPLTSIGYSSRGNSRYVYNLVTGQIEILWLSVGGKRALEHKVEAAFEEAGKEEFFLSPDNLLRYFANHTLQTLPILQFKYTIPANFYETHNVQAISHDNFRVIELPYEDSGIDIVTLFNDVYSHPLHKERLFVDGEKQAELLAYQSHPDPKESGILLNHSAFRDFFLQHYPNLCKRPTTKPEVNMATFGDTDSYLENLNNLPEDDEDLGESHPF
jgi:hypothetical protein